MKPLPFPSAVVLVVFMFWAQVVALRALAPEPAVSVAFRVVALQESNDTRLGYRQDGELKPLVIPVYEPSETYRYTGPKTMVIVRLAGEAEAVAPGGEAREPVVATVDFDSSVKQATVLLIPAARRYHAIVIPSDADQFPSGNALVLNLARNRLSLLCNQKETILLTPGERRLLPANSRGELDVNLSLEKGGHWQASERTYVPVLPGQQTIVAIVPNPAGGGGVEMIVLRQKTGDTKTPAPAAKPPHTIQP